MPFSWPSPFNIIINQSFAFSPGSESIYNFLKQRKALKNMGNREKHRKTGGQHRKTWEIQGKTGGNREKHGKNSAKQGKTGENRRKRWKT